jgi:nucleoid DNA-binding protein
MDIEPKTQFGKPEFVSVVAERAGFTKKDTLEILNVFIDVIRDIILADGELTLKGLFTVRVARQKPRTITSGKLKGSYPESYAISFKPSVELKHQLWEAFGVDKSKTRIIGKEEDKEEEVEEENI